MTEQPTYGQAQRATDEQQRRAIADAVRNAVASGGRVESSTPYDALIRYGKPTSHILHLVLTLVTFGFWAPVWIGVGIYNHTQQRAEQLTVDEYGRVLTHRL